MALFEIVLPAVRGHPFSTRASEAGELQASTPTLLAGTGLSYFEKLAEQPETFLRWFAIHSRAGPDHVRKCFAVRGSPFNPHLVVVFIDAREGAGPLGHGAIYMKRRPA